jgi:membrane associated rhomboid family serine protease
MAAATDTLKRICRQGNIVTQLICINAALFLLFAIVRIVLKLFNVVDPSWLYCLSLPAAPYALLRRPWSPFTYMFMHADAWHLLFNMLWLWWFGRLFLRYFSARHLRGLYILAGLVGGALFVISFNLFPLFRNSLSQSLLVGASASILGIVIATAVHEPNYRITLLFFGSVALKWLAVVTVVIDMLLIASDNAGGHFAHLGGALAGWAFVPALRKGIDITAWINAVIDFFGGLFHRRPHRPKVKKAKVKKMKVRKQKKACSSAKKGASQPKNAHSDDYRYNASRKQQADEMDRILEKIKQQGYAGLTDEEKHKLFEASNR